MTSIFANFGQIFDGKTLYYRVEMDKNTSFISSNKETFSREDLEGKGIRFPTIIQNYEAQPYPCLKTESWSTDSIKAFLDSKMRIIDPKELFLRVKQIIQRFPHPEDEKQLLLLTLFPFQTGLYSAFQSTSYFSLFGNPYLTQKLCDLMEEICFSGIQVNSPNPSLMSRTTALHGGTQIITIPDNHRGNLSFNSIWAILEEGWRSSGSFYVLNEFGFPISLPIYAPRLLNVGLRGKYRIILPIEIHVETKPVSSFPFRTNEIDQDLIRLRDDLHIFCLENVTPITDISHGLQPISEMLNQLMESLSGMSSIARYLDSFFEIPFLFDAVITAAKDMSLRFKHDQNFDDKDSHIRYLVAEFIQRFAPDEEGYYFAHHLARYVNKAGDFPKELRPEDVTRRLKGFTPYRDRDYLDEEGEGKKRQRTKIGFDYDKFLKQVLSD